MFLDEIFVTRLDEDVNGRFAVAFHRTKSTDRIMDIDATGFQAGNGDTYGRGIYLTYDFDSQLTDYMRRYGPYLVKSRVTLDEFLIFDEEPARRVYGEKWTLRDQWQMFGLPTDGDLGAALTQMEDARATYDYTSRAALVFANARRKTGGVTGPLKDIRGLIFSGSKDGRVIVAYKPADVIPFAYARVLIDPAKPKSLDKVKWKPLNVKSAVQRGLRQKRQSMALAAAKFLARRGFTVVTRSQSRMIAVKPFEGGGTLVATWSSMIGGGFHITRRWPPGQLDRKQIETVFGATQTTGIVVARESHEKHGFRDDRAFLAALARAEKAVANLKVARDEQVRVAEAVLRSITKPGTQIVARLPPTTRALDFGEEKMIVGVVAPDSQEHDISIFMEAPYRAVEDEKIDNYWRNACYLRISATVMSPNAKPFIKDFGVRYPYDWNEPTRIVESLLQNPGHVYNQGSTLEFSVAMADDIAERLRWEILPRPLYR